jgi:nucleotide-binding universal stress UspA family protein
VRNTPLAEVIDSLRRQSGEIIVVDTNLDTKITLDLKNASLTDALQRVARQASALAGVVHALYSSEDALGQLKTTLQAGDDLERAGWSTLAPRMDGPMMKPPGEPETLPLEPGGPPAGARRVLTHDVQAFAPAPGKPGPVSTVGKRGKGPEDAPMMVMRFENSDAAGNVHTVIWSPERIVASADLSAKLPPLEGTPPSRKVADHLAQEAHASCTTLYVLKRSLVPVDNLMHAPGGLREFSGAAAEGGSNDVKGVRRDDVEARIMREKMSQYEELTAEQRVQRARQLQDYQRKP